MIGSPKTHVDGKYEQGPWHFVSSLLPRKHKHNCYCAQEVLSGLRQPVAVVHCGDGSQRLFVLEREGIVRILNHNLELIKEPFLDIHKIVQSGLKVGPTLPRTVTCEL